MIKYKLSSHKLEEIIWTHEIKNKLKGLFKNLSLIRHSE